MEYVFQVLCLFGLYLLLTISLNFLVGYVGIMYIGHIAFFAIGAYISTIAASHYGVSPIISIFIAAIISCFASGILGILTVRLSGHYLLMSSLGICEIFRSVINNSSITGGAEGLIVKNSPSLSPLISANFTIMILIITFLILEIVFFLLLIKSPKGRAFLAVRDDPILLISFGISVSKLKMQALMISAVWASIAGSLFAYYSKYIDPSSFTIMDSLILLVVIMIGGLGSFKGSIFGALLLIVLPSLIRFFDISITIMGSIQQILFALILLLILFVYPKGIFGKVILT